MTQDNTQILYDERLAKTELITNQILEIMKNNNSYESAQELLEKNVNKKLNESKLRVAFIGQYSEPPRDCRRLNILREYDNENTKLHS